MAAVDCVLPSASLLGEGALWDVAAQALWWLDIKGRLIHRYDPAAGTNASWLAPHDVGSLAMRAQGGLDGRLATNPIAYAYPSAEGAAVVADFSTSVAPEGVIRSLLHRGLPAPPGALHDAAGRPTGDPAALYATPRGAIQPPGGAAGYRGTALALLVDVLAALLADDDADDSARTGSNLSVLAIATGDGFAGRAERMGHYLRSSRPIDPAHPVLLPGEREQRAAARAEGIAVDGPTWAARNPLQHGSVRRCQSIGVAPLPEKSCNPAGVAYRRTQRFFTSPTATPAHNRGARTIVPENDPRGTGRDHQ